MTNKDDVQDIRITQIQKDLSVFKNDISKKVLLIETMLIDELKFNARIKGGISVLGALGMLTGLVTLIIKAFGGP